MGAHILRAPFRLRRRFKIHAQAGWNCNMEVGLIIPLFRPVFGNHRRAVFHLCLELDCEAESRFRGRTSCYRDVYFLSLNATDSFWAYFTFRVVGLNETLFRSKSDAQRQVVSRAVLVTLSADLENKSEK